MDSLVIGLDEGVNRADMWLREHIDEHGLLISGIKDFAAYSLLPSLLLESGHSKESLSVFNNVNEKILNCAYSDVTLQLYNLKSSHAFWGDFPCIPLSLFGFGAHQIRRFEVL